MSTLGTKLELIDRPHLVHIILFRQNIGHEWPVRMNYIRALELTLLRRTFEHERSL